MLPERSEDLHELITFCNGPRLVMPRPLRNDYEQGVMRWEAEDVMREGGVMRVMSC